MADQGFQAHDGTKSASTEFLGYETSAPGPKPRPAGLPYGYAGGEHDPHKDTDYATALAGLEVYDGDLCEKCEGFNLGSLFDYLRVGISEYSLAMTHVEEHEFRCMFCRLVATAYSKRPEILRNGCHEVVVRAVCTSGRPNSTNSHIHPWMLLCVFVKICERQDPLQPGGEVNGNMLTDFGYDPNDPLLALELVDIPSAPPRVQITELLHTLTASSSCSDSDDSDDSDFEAAWIEKQSAAWRLRKFRQSIPSQFDYDRLRVRLHTQDAEPFETAFEHQSPVASLAALIDSSRLRMIDVATGNVVVLRQQERFLALSYVWGGFVFHGAAVIRPDRLLCSPDLAWSIDWRHVPKTIRDAVDFVRQLGERYLWVDSLCIDQADVNDKRAIIPEMLSIYGGSYLTIFAVAGSDAHYGLPGANAESRKAEHCITLRGAHETLHLLPARPDGFSVIERSAWNTRAWTYQEHALSRRSLFFTEHEVHLYRGGEHSYSERYRTVPIELSGKGKLSADETINGDGQIRVPVLLDALRQAEALSWAHYGQGVVTYTLRKLTHPGDRLAAFLGMYNRFCHVDTSSAARHALSGLPSHWFYQCLMWTPNPRSLQAGEHARVRFDATQSRALPSWSWVGWTGRIDMPEYRQREVHKQISVTVLDDWNIRCDNVIMGELSGSPLPSESCNDSAVDGIVLHLRATIVDLWIIRSKWHPARAGCDIMRSRSENLANDKLGHVKLDEAVAAKYCDEEAHDFMVLDTMLMLVEKYGAFYERIALGSMKLVSDDCRQRMTVQIQGWGREEHVKLR